MSKAAGVVMVWVLWSSCVSFGAYEFYLELYGAEQGLIRGDCLRSNWVNKIVCVEFKHTITAERDLESCFPTSRLNHLPLTIVKLIDRSTPQLLAAIDNNERLRGTLYFVRVDDMGEEYIAHTITFENAYIAGITQETVAVNVSVQDRETVALVYSEIVREWRPTDTLYAARGYPACGQELRISDLNFDGAVNLLDLAVFADQWLAGAN